MTHLERVLAALDIYATSLLVGLKGTNRPTDRRDYEGRLSGVGIIYATLRTGRVEDAMSRASSEAHATGWGYLEGPAGEQAEQAFGAFYAELQSFAREDPR